MNTCGRICVIIACFPIRSRCNLVSAIDVLYFEAGRFKDQREGFDNYPGLFKDDLSNVA